MNDMVYPPNSRKYREEQSGPKSPAPEEKRVKKIVKTPVKTKKNEMRRFADIFISEDASNVKNYIFMDVLVPAIKKAIYDIVTNGIDMFLYGGTGRSKNTTSGNKVSYRSYFDQKTAADPGYHGSENNRSRGGLDYDDIVFGSRGEAEAAIQQMMDTIDRYTLVRVADLYDMVDLTAPITAQKYGWMSLKNAEVKRTRDGYILKLPRAVPLD